MDKIPVSAVCTNKDGDKYLEKALKSVDWCDQKIFLDDNSTDSSLEIAEKLGWEIWNWPKDAPNSMCARRNYSIGFEGNKKYTPYWMSHEKLKDNHPVVNNDWILQVDHDEIFDDDTYDAIKNVIEDDTKGKDDIDSFAFHLINVYTEGERKGETMTEIPLGRMFRTGKVYWEKHIQNDAIFEGSVGWIGTVVRHYGYGSYLEHWEKQYARITANEERVSEDPDNLMSRAYLINCLCVIGDRSVINLDRIVAQMCIALDDKKMLKRNRITQATIERCLRHFWAVCVNLDRFYTFLVVLAKVEEYVDWIVDVPYWKIQSYLNINPIDIGIVEEEARKFMRRMAEYKAPPVENIEVQSMGCEKFLCDKIYELYYTALINIEPSNDAVLGIAKICNYWMRTKYKHLFIQAMERKQIGQHRTEKISHTKLLDYSVEHYWANDIEKEGIYERFAKDLNKIEHKKKKKYK